ncbi:Arginine transport system permease protein ArtQ [subsurface metagenome]
MNFHDLYYYFFNIDFFIKTLPDLLKGLIVTIKIAGLSLIMGFILGLILAVVRVTVKQRSNPLIIRLLNIPIAIYVDVLRSVPPLIILIVVYYALPYINIMIPRFWAAVFTFVAILSAFSEEIFRATIESIDRGQVEAARSLGLSYMQTMVSVVIIQAFRIALPPMTSRLIAITKDVSLASVIGVADLLKKARAAQAFYANPTPIFSAALLFTILFLPLVRLSMYIEKKMAD